MENKNVCIVGGEYCDRHMSSFARAAHKIMRRDEQNRVWNNGVSVCVKAQYISGGLVVMVGWINVYSKEKDNERYVPGLLPTLVVVPYSTVHQLFLFLLSFLKNNNCFCVYICTLVERCTLLYCSCSCADCVLA